MERTIRGMADRLAKRIPYELIFLLVWALYNVQYTLLYSSELSYMFDTEGIRKAIEYAVIFVQLFLFSLLLWQYRANAGKLATSLLFMALVAVIALQTRSKTFLIRTLFILTAQPIAFKRIVRFDIKIKLPLLCLIILLACTGVINNYQVTTNGAFKQALGFDHPNTFTCYALCTLLEILYLRFQQINWKDWVFQIACSLMVFLIGRGRTSYYVYMLILILFWVAKVKPQIYASRIVQALLMISAPVMSGITFLSIQLYSKGNQFMLAIDRMLTDRLKSGAQMMSQYDVKLFGQGMEFLRSRDAKLDHVTPILLDNAYVRCLLMYGLVFFVVFIALYVLLFYRLRTGKTTALALLALFFVVLGFGESYLLNITYNLTLLLLFKSSSELAMEAKGSCDEHSAPGECGGIPKMISQLTDKLRLLCSARKEKK